MKNRVLVKRIDPQRVKIILPSENICDIEVEFPDGKTVMLEYRQTHPETINILDKACRTTRGY